MIKYQCAYFLVCCWHKKRNSVMATVFDNEPKRVFLKYTDYTDFTEKYIGQITVEQKPFTTEALRRGVSPLFFSVASCLSGSKNVQPIADYYRFHGKERIFLDLSMFIRVIRQIRLQKGLKKRCLSHYGFV